MDKYSELVPFPPGEGEEENWMFPYDIKDQFFMSPRNRRRRSKVAQFEQWEKDLSPGPETKLYEHLLDKHELASDNGIYLPSTVDYPHVANTHYRAHVELENKHQHSDIPMALDEQEEQAMQLVGDHYLSGQLTPDQFSDISWQLHGRAASRVVPNESAVLHMIVHHAVPIEVFPKNFHDHDDDGYQLLQNNTSFQEHMRKHHNVDNWLTGENLDLESQKRFHSADSHNPHNIHFGLHVGDDPSWVVHSHNEGDELMPPGYISARSSLDNLDRYGFPLV